MDSGLGCRLQVAGCRTENKKGQVTIFVIVGAVIVVGIIAVVLLMGDIRIGHGDKVSPKGVVQSCVRDLVEDSVDKMMRNGGARAGVPSEEGKILASQAIMYQGEEWGYLCYQADYYQGCYNIHPMLERQIENEIRKDTIDGVQGCFDIMREIYEEEGYDVGGGATSYSVDLLPGYVDVNIEKRVEISKTGSSETFDDFGLEVVSPIYKLAQVARLIVNDESQFCNFEYNGYMLLYPEFDIRKIDYVDSKLYRVIDRRSKAEFRFAIRSCAFAPGI